MDDLISRQQAIDALKDATFDFEACKTVLEQLPCAQPKKGKWIRLDMHAHLADHKCTACGQECYVPTCMGEPLYAFCPNCGAKMEATT